MSAPSPAVPLPPSADLRASGGARWGQAANRAPGCAPGCDRPEGGPLFNLLPWLQGAGDRSGQEVPTLDRWCRRAALGAVLGLAAALLGLGLLLYRPSTAFAGPADVNPVLNAVADAPSARSSR